MNFIVIKVRKDNLMYLFYNDNVAFSFDPFNPKAITYALSCDLIPFKIYSIDDLFKIKNTKKERKLLYSFTTHHHFDHAGGNDELKKLSKNTKMISFYNFFSITDFSDDFKKVNNIFNVTDNSEIISKIECIQTPVHTKDSISYKIDDKYLITGDFLFKLGCGRFFEGNGKDFISSINIICKNCNNSIILLYGHDYYTDNLKFAKTIKNYSISDLEYLNSKFFLSLEDEIKYNPFLNNKILNNHEEIDNLRKLKDNFK